MAVAHPSRARSRAVLAARARALTQIAAALVIGSGAAAFAGACGASTADITDEPDSGDQGTSLQPAACPKIEPDSGSQCLVPEGTTCDFGQCGTRLAVCSAGAWRAGGNATPNPACPAAPPTPTFGCPACWPPAKTCFYGSTDCTADDASTNTAVASCPNGSWNLDIQPCRDGGGPDVQGDGGPDAD